MVHQNWFRGLVGDGLHHVGVVAHGPVNMFQQLGVKVSFALFQIPNVLVYEGLAKSRWTCFFLSLHWLDFSKFTSPSHTHILVPVSF